ncbi:zinc finger C2HC domain-containing protein 1B-like [Enoplosus armatus]|uniref:zinc finger C2HC domain-containing protein 1B-like n=1 Tax=Enoplosus armatus TaxID=215367 RepID=UPI0039960E53
MARAIHAKELMLQEKLWRVEEKIRQKIQRDNIDAAAGSSHSSRPEQGELRLLDSTDTGLQLLPCRICNRKFASERLETHVQICKKVKQSHRQVFNSYVSRTKGSAIEEFWKTHSRTKTPEVLKKKNLNQNHKANTRNLREGRLPAGTSQLK